MLGYSNSNLSGRVAFVEHVSIAIFIIGISLYWGGWAIKSNKFNFTRENCFVLALICILPLSYYFNIDHAMELTTNKMLWHLANGDFAVVCERNKYIINQIENSLEKDVVVSLTIVKDDDEWANLNGIGLTVDPEHWVNVAVADYYDKDSVVLICVDADSE